MERTDAELAADCLGGDREAFGELVQRHQNSVYNLAWRKTGNTAEADDLAQEAFIRAFERLHQYKPEYSFRNWVMGICANLSRNRFRGRMRREAAEREHLDRAALDEARPDEDGRREALDRALMDLPETMRVPIVMKYMEGLSIEEIARALRIGLSAVKMRLARGRQELEARLKGGREVTT
jgi:RNA polymerase sigma-70 factor, ECF subfamily